MHAFDTLWRMRFIESPHHNARPHGTGIDLIVLHAISLPPGEFAQEYIEAFFTGRLDCNAHPYFESLGGIRVSAHFVVGRSGHITQFVPVSQRAWHAGISSWQGVENCNDYSIGIEIIGDEDTLFTAAQYRETARLCRMLMQQFPDITVERIVGHQHVAPGRKWDPGKQWDWKHFHRSLAHIQKLQMEMR